MGPLWGQYTVLAGRGRGRGGAHAQFTSLRFSSVQTLGRLGCRGNLKGKCAAILPIKATHKTLSMKDRRTDGEMTNTCCDFVNMHLYLVVKYSIPVVNRNFYTKAKSRSSHLKKESDPMLTLKEILESVQFSSCLLYTSPSPRDRGISRMPSSA